MKKQAFSYLSASLLALLVAAAASAQAWRGTGRLSGIVVDQNGKPVKGAKVTLLAVRGSNTGPEPILTDAKGSWVAGGLIGGQWLIDIEAEGFLVRKSNANVSEVERLAKPIKLQLEPKPEEKPKEPEPEPMKETIQVGGVEITPETAAAIEAANNFMKAEQWKEAAAEYEKAVAALSTNMQLKAAMARAYYGAGELKKAIAALQEVHAADGSNVIYATLLADMLLESGDVAGGEKVLSALPAGSLTDPNTIINLGVRFVNNNKPEQAYKLFNDAVTVASDFAPAYYYRALALVQLQKIKDAKADLQKVIELGPDTPEAKEAKELLAQIK